MGEAKKVSEAQGCPRSSSYVSVGTHCPILTVLPLIISHGHTNACRKGRIASLDLTHLAWSNFQGYCPCPWKDVSHPLYVYLHLQRVLYLRPGWPNRSLKILFAVSITRPTPVVGCCGKAHRKAALKFLLCINQPGVGGRLGLWRHRGHRDGVLRLGRAAWCSPFASSLIFWKSTSGPFHQLAHVLSSARAELPACLSILRGGKSHC